MADNEEVNEEVATRQQAQRLISCRTGWAR